MSLAHSTDEPDDIAAEEAAQLLGEVPSSIRRLIDRGYLHAHLTDGRHRLSRAEVLAYKVRQAAVRRETLAELVRFTQEHDI